MKKVKINAAKLELNKKRISSLSQDQMTKLYGGDDGYGSLPTNCTAICVTQLICTNGCPPPTNICTPTTQGCTTQETGTCSCTCIVYCTGE